MANRPIKRKKTSASNREQQRIKKKKAEKTVSPLVFGLRIAAILAVYLIAYIFLSHSTFKVENIAVEGNSVISAEDIISLSGISVGDDIFQTDVNAAEDQISLHVMIDDVNVRIRPFHKILIEITEKDAVAQFVLNDTYYYINENLTVVGESDSLDEKLPLFLSDDLPDFISIGMNLKSAGLESDLVIAKAIQNHFDGYEVVIAGQGESDNAIYINGVEVRLGTDSRFDEKVEAIEKLLASMSELKLESLEYIDVSIADEPVLKERPIGDDGSGDDEDKEETSTPSKSTQVKNKRDTSEAE